MKKSNIIGYDSNPKSTVAQNMIYNNMSHHYRRLYGAKPCVDSGLKVMKQKQRNSNICNKGFYLNKNSTGSCRVSQMNLGIRIPNLSPLCKENKPMDVLDSLKQVPFRPRILKTDAESKLRSLRVYHPPRKKTCACGTLKKQCVTLENREEIDEDDYEEDWLDHQDNMRSASKHGSSSDSAYTEEGEGMWSRGESRDGSPQQVHHPAQTRSEDSPYIHFVRSITDDVLRKGIYTNKALKRVFHEHINKNRGVLDARRMQLEIEKLQDDLGIPKEDDLDELDYGLGGGLFSTSPDLDEMEEKERQLLDSLDRLSVEEQPLSEAAQKENWVTQTLPFEKSVTLKLPAQDDDNDSSIGYDVASESSDKSNSNRV